MGPITPKPKPMPVRRGDASYWIRTARQPPTPPPNGVVEPEPANDQARVKFWRDRALYAEARLAERDRQLQQQGQQILDLIGPSGGNIVVMSSLCIQGQALGR